MSDNTSDTGGRPVEPLPEKGHNGQDNKQVERIEERGSGSGHDLDEKVLEHSKKSGEKKENRSADAKSAIPVKNPNQEPGGKVVRELLRKAAENDQGCGLESDKVKSTCVDEKAAVRYIVFWRDGFTVEDSGLLRYDDPANSLILHEINSGYVRPSLLNVLPGQLVELRVAKCIDQKYVPTQSNPSLKRTKHRPSPPITLASTSSNSEPNVCQVVLEFLKSMW